MAELSPAVQEALKSIEAGRKEQESRVAKFDRAYEIYTAAPPKTRGVEPWQSQLRVPYAKQVIDTSIFNIVSGQPKIQVTPRSQGDDAAAKAMELILGYYVGEDHLVEKQPVIAQQSLVYGVTVAKPHWLYSETTRPTRTFTHNPLDPTVPIEQVQLAQVITRDGPTLEPWNVYHAFWEPGARDVDDARYVVLQSWLTKDDLRQLAFDAATNRGIYQNVEALIATGAHPQPNPTAQARNLSSGQREQYKDRFLIEEIWTDDELVVIGNKQILLRQQQNPYWHGKKPVVAAQTLPDLFEMVGFSETQLVDHLQQALHTVQNMRFDNLHLTVMRGITYREGGVTDPNALELRPRFKWAVTDHDDIRPFEVQPLPPEAYGEENALLSRMQLVSGISPYVSGADLQTVDQNTATGVTALQEVAGRALRFRAAQIQYKIYQRSFEMWGDMTQQFLDKPVEVKIVGPGNQHEWRTITPADVAGHFAYKIEGSEESLSRQQERGEAIALLNAFAPLLATEGQLINIQPILERVAAAYDFPNPQSLFNAPPPQQPAAPTPQQFNPQIRGPQIGAVPASHLNVQQGSLPQDQLLRAAQAVIGPGATNG